MRAAPVLVALLLSACGGGAAPVVSAGGASPALRCSGLPGERVELDWNGRSVSITTPANERASIGTLEVAGLDPAPLRLARDGSLEEVWTWDSDGDGRDELLLVVRGAGSGGFLQLLLLSDGPGKPTVTPLPRPTDGNPTAYRRGGRVEVRDQRLVLTYERYGDGIGLVADPVRKALEGEPPVRLHDDPQADPRGGEARALLERTTGRWK